MCKIQNNLRHQSAHQSQNSLLRRAPLNLWIQSLKEKPSAGSRARLPGAGSGSGMDQNKGGALTQKGGVGIGGGTGGGAGGPVAPPLFKLGGMAPPCTFLTILF